MRLIQAIILAILSIIFYNMEDGLSLLYCGIATNVLLIYHIRKAKPFAIMFFFFLTYIINQIPYYAEGYDLTPYSQFDSFYFCLKTTFIHTLFLTSILALIPNIKKEFFIRDHLILKKNNLLFFIVVMCMLILIAFGITGTSTYEAGGYIMSQAQGTKTLGGMALHEYFIPLIPLAYIFSGGDRKKHILIILMICLYLIKSFGYTGGRADTIPVFLMAFILFIDSPKAKYIYILPPAVLMFLFMHIYAFLRFDFAVFSDWQALYSLSKFALEELGIKTLYNQNDIFYASNRIIAFKELGIISPERLLVAYPLNLLSIFVPSRFIPPWAIPSSYLSEIYPVGGGGLISAFYYFYFGYFGVIGVGFFVGYIIRRSFTSSSQYMLLYSIMISVTYARWLGYSHITLIKLSFYAIPVYFLARLLHNVVKNNGR